MIEATYTYRCTYCQKVVDDKMFTEGVPGMQIITPRMAPSGWLWIGMSLVCPSHSIAVDGRIDTHRWKDDQAKRCRLVDVVQDKEWQAIVDLDGKAVTLPLWQFHRDWEAI